MVWFNVIFFLKIELSSTKRCEVRGEQAAATLALSWQLQSGRSVHEGGEGGWYKNCSCPGARCVCAARELLLHRAPKCQRYWMEKRFGGTDHLTFIPCAKPLLGGGSYYSAATGNKTRNE